MPRQHALPQSDEMEMRLRARLARVNPRVPIAVVHFGVTPIEHNSVEMRLRTASCLRRFFEGVDRSQGVLFPERLDDRIGGTVQRAIRSAITRATRSAEKCLVRFPHMDDRLAFQGAEATVVQVRCALLGA